MIEVQMNGVTYRFPDDTSEEVMRTALLKQNAKQTPDPASDVSAVEAFTIGAGRTVDKFIEGAKDLGYRLGDLSWLPMNEKAAERGRQQIAEEQKANDEVYGRLADKRPVATTLGEVAGYAPTMFVGGGVVPQVATAAATGATMYGTDEERAANAGIDATLTALPYGAGKVLQKALTKTGEGASRLTKVADEKGYPLTLGERTNNDTLRGFEASVESQPFIGGPLRNLKNQRQDFTNQVARESIGETSGNVADSAIPEAASRIGEIYEATAKIDVPVGDDFLRNLVSVSDRAKRGVLGGGNTDKIVNNIVDLIDENGVLSGRQVQQIRTTIQTELTNAARTGNATKEYLDALGSIVNALDFEVHKVLTKVDPELAAKLTTAREQYRNLRLLEQSRAVNEAGDVSGRKLGAYLSTRDPKGYRRGTNTDDLYEVARLERQFPPLPNSGTATRMSIPNTAMQTVVTGGLNIPVGIAARGAVAAYTNPKRYIKPVTAAGRATIDDDEDLRALLERLTP